jgi:hypothetical protein
VQQTDAFPWFAIGDGPIDTTGEILTPALRSALDLQSYMRDRYAHAVAEVARVDGEDHFTHRMRVMSYLHLTRFVRILADRKDNEHGRRPGGARAVLRPPPRRVRLQHPLVVEDLRRPGEEPAAGRDTRRAAASI